MRWLALKKAIGFPSLGQISLFAVHGGGVMKPHKKEPQSLKRTVMENLGANGYRNLDSATKREIKEIDLLRKLSAKNKLSFDDLVPA